MLPWVIRLVVFCLLIPPVLAAPGDLDGAFGAPGRVLIPFSNPSFVFFLGEGEGGSAEAVLEQDDGKIVTAGGGELFCARQNPNGSLDTSFATSGRLAQYTGRNVSLADMARQSDGRIVCGGYIRSSGSAMVVRVGSDGVLDPAFGTAGYARIPGWGAGRGRPAVRIAVQSDDKIVLVGPYDSLSFLVARVDASGQLDVGFGTQGTVSVPLGGAEVRASSVKVQNDGKILVGGVSDGNFAMVRLQTNGSLDGTFGQGGKVVIDLGGDGDECVCLALREGGKILAGGLKSHEGREDFALVGCLEDGTLDAGFGVGGKIVTSLSTYYRDRCTAVAVRSDGKIIAVGQVTSNTGVNECMVGRYASNGMLDASFAGSGRILFPLAADGGDANAVCLGAGGNIIVAGRGQDGSRSDFAVARLTEEGALDSSFRGGWMTSSFGENDLPWDASVQSDGKILVCGGAGFPPSGHITVARYSQTGEIDESFGTQGKARAYVAGRSSYASRIALQPDGKMVVIGNTSLRDCWAIVRFLADGTLDSTFGEGGRVVTTMGAGKQEAFGVALQPDGKVVVVGSAQPGTDYDFAVARYLPDGSLDASFGSAGKVITTLSSGEDVAWSVIVQPDGKILVSGWATNDGNLDFAVVRHHPDGTLDTGFGTGGRILTTIGQGHDRAFDIKLQQDGKIILAGVSATTISLGAPTDSVLVRYHPDGTLDTSFGSDGKSVTRFNNASSWTNRVGLQADGRIVTAGSALDFNGVRGACLVRYNEDGSRDTGFGLDGMAHLAIGNWYGSATSSSLVIQKDGTFLLVGTIRHMNTSECFIAQYKAGTLLPMVGGGTALNVLTDSTSMTGTVLPNGSVTTARLEYGPTTAYGSVASIVLSPADGTATQNVSVGLSGLTPGTTYHYRLTASNAAGTRSTAGTTFTTLTLHQGWRQHHFGLSANSGNAADTFDFDSDGLPNLLEWACGSSPTTGSLLRQATTLHGGELRFTYSRSVEAFSTGTLFSVEWNDSLLGASWNTAGVVQTVLSDNGITQQVQAVLPAGEAGRRFVRLKVESP